MTKSVWVFVRIENLDFMGFVLTCKLAKIGFFYSLATKMLPEKGDLI